MFIGKEPWFAVSIVAPGIAVVNPSSNRRDHVDQLVSALRNILICHESPLVCARPRLLHVNGHLSPRTFATVNWIWIQTPSVVSVIKKKRDKDRRENPGLRGCGASPKRVASVDLFDVDAICLILVGDVGTGKITVDEFKYVMPVNHWHLCLAGCVLLARLRNRCAADALTFGNWIRVVDRSFMQSSKAARSLLAVVTTAIAVCVLPCSVLDARHSCRGTGHAPFRRAATGHWRRQRFRAYGGRIAVVGAAAAALAHLDAWRLQ